MRMRAYCFSFDATGEQSIDLVLSAVACAGDMYHHTEGWNLQTEAYEPHTGKTPVEWIQRAGDSAARELEALRSERDAARAEVVRLRAEREAAERALMLVISSPGWTELTESDRAAVRVALAALAEAKP